jgi:hypothetical protein
MRLRASVSDDRHRFAQWFTTGRMRKAACLSFTEQPGFAVRIDSKSE